MARCHCLHSDTYGVITHNGVVVRQGTICDLDGFCWASKRPLLEMDPDYVQPLKARQVSVEVLLRLDKDASGLIE